MASSSPDTQAWRHRARAVATGSMVVLAVLSIVATSKSQPTIEDKAEGAPLVLDPEHQIVTAEFEVAESDATSVGGGLGGWEIEAQLFWREVPPDQQHLGISAQRTSGSSNAFLERLHCLGDGCVGAFEVTFRFPRKLERGSVHVSWRIRAWVEFEDRNQPPEGARLKVTIGTPVGSAAPPDRVWAEQISVSYEEPVVVWAVELQSRTGFSPGSIFAEAGPLRYPNSLEPWPVWEPAPISAGIVPPSGAPFRLAPATASPIPIPRGCETDPCSISMKFIVQLEPPLPYGFSPTIDLGIVGPPGEDVVAHAVEVQAPITETVHQLEPIHLLGTQRRSSGVEITLDAESIPRDSFRGMDPLLWAELVLGADETAVRALGDNAIGTSFGFPEPDDAYTWGRTRDLGMNEPMIIVIPNDCVPGKTCTVPLGFSFSAYQALDDDEAVTLRPTLRVFLAYPEATAPPGATAIVVETGTPTP